jgi:hypothetical protein
LYRMTSAAKRNEPKKMRQASARRLAALTRT